MTTQDPRAIPRPTNAADTILDTIDGQLDALTDITASHERRLDELTRQVADHYEMIQHLRLQMNRQLMADDGISDGDCAQLAKRLWAEAEVRQSEATLGTREQWAQIEHLHKAAMHLYSVHHYGQISAHPTHHETDSNDKETQK